MSTEPANNEASASCDGYPFPRIGSQAYFVKSGCIVVIIDHADDKWTVEKMNGKRMTATTDGLKQLGPFGCLCKELRHTAVGDGCELCNG